MAASTPVDVEELALVCAESHVHMRDAVLSQLAKHRRHGRSFLLNPTDSERDAALGNGVRVIVRNLERVPDQAADEVGFDLGDYVGRRSVGDGILGKLLLYRPILSSTQTVLHQHIPLLATGAGLVCVADIQTQGKGRRTNVWDSPVGCLMFSFQCMQRDGAKMPFLQYLVSLALVEAIHGLDQHCRELPLRLKWPNDIYALDRKLGGILLESNSQDGVFHITIGVGINVTNAEPSVSLAELLRAASPGFPAPKRSAVLDSFCETFDRMYRVFDAEGFGPFEERYLATWLHSGQIVRTDTSTLPIKLVGLTPVGYLRGVDSAGTQYELQPDGNRFDFLAGLISAVLPTSTKQ